MAVQSETYMIYRGDGKQDKDNLAVVTISAAAHVLTPMSSRLELRANDGKLFATLKWDESLRIRKVG